MRHLIFTLFATHSAIFRHNSGLQQGVHGQEKVGGGGGDIFSRSENCKGILKFVREFWNLSTNQGKVREF